MKTAPLHMKIISMIGLLCGINWIFMALTNNNKPILLILGIIMSVSNIGLFLSLSFAKIASITLSIIIFSLYIFLIYLYIKSNYYYSWGVALVSLSPALLWSILIVISCCKKPQTSR